MRYPIAAGSFYEGEKGLLLKQIESCFLSKFGPGKLPKEEKNTNKNKIISAIVPHAGYMCSGMCAAHVYAKLANHMPDTIIIIGTDHTGSGSGISIEDWKTPLGMIEVDKGFCKQLIASSESGLIINERSHSDEHSIEVQLPFLQYIYNHVNDHKFNIVPVTISFDIDYKKVAKAIHDVMKTRKENKKGNKKKNKNNNFAIIASGDFTHYGQNYGYVPFEGTGKQIKQKLKELDKKAIDYVLNLDSKSFIDYLNKTKATICGRFGFTVLIELNKLFDLKNKGKLLKYYTSGDVFDDFNNCVSYVSALFY